MKHQTFSSNLQETSLYMQKLRQSTTREVVVCETLERSQTLSRDNVMSDII